MTGFERPSASEVGAVNRNVGKRLTDDGTFDMQPVWFTRRFGYGTEDAPVEPHRYTLIGLTTCGYNRRSRIVLRLLGLDAVIRTESLPGIRENDEWVLSPDGLGAEFGYRLLADFYAAGDPDYQGRATSPAVVDERTGRVVTNNYHTLTLDWETVWRPYWKPGAPDLYPTDLRREIDMLNEQLFDDVNNGTYKIVFTPNPRVARIQLDVFKARLADLDYRLESRRYLFGARMTDSDIRLFQTLGSYETMYRPGIVRRLGGEDGVPHLWDYPALWAYARDLFQTPGMIDDEELYELGFVPDKDGRYSSRLDAGSRGNAAGFFFGGGDTTHRGEFLAAWREPANREHLTGDERYCGPGSAGLANLWRFA